MGLKRWIVSNVDKEQAAYIADSYGYPPLLALLLATRGICGREEIEDFLSEGFFSDPWEWKGMKEAVARISRAIENYESIAVYGDYDADGVTATVLFYSYLESCGANVIYYIPSREEEGYGMSETGVSRLAEKGVRLIVTVDNGISAVREIAYAASLGIDTVVTDHHTPPQILPEAVAIVNPHQPGCGSSYKEFCGVGVAFKVVCALEGENCDSGLLLENFADLIAIGTVGDIVPLTGENRSLVKRGLPMICQTERLGLRSLLKCAGLENKPVSAGDVAFKIVPRINAMGRMGSSERAVRLFLSDYEQEADEIAEQMNEENSARQQEEVKILRELSSQIEQEPDRLLDRVLVFWGEGWHQGVLGIVSSRVTEKYGKPSVILSTCGTEAKGSARSIPGFSIHEALTSCQELLTKYGGHTLAAGMTLPVENLPAFRQALNETAAEREEEVYPVLSIDLKLKPSLVGLDTVKQMEALAPFGAGNPTPVFGLYHMRLEEIVPLSGGKHLRLSFSREETRISALRFGMGPEEFPYSKGDILDLAVNLERSEYRGQEQVSILIKDMKPAGLENEELLGQKSRYEAFRRGDRVPGEKLLSMIPTREETGAVYRLLRGEQRREAWNLFSMCNCLRKAKIGYDKLMISLHMMEDVGLLSFRTDGERAQIRLAKVERKADLEASPTLQKLRRLTA